MNIIFHLEDSFHKSNQIVSFSDSPSKLVTLNFAGHIIINSLFFNVHYNGIEPTEDVSDLFS